MRRYFTFLILIFLSLEIYAQEVQKVTVLVQNLDPVIVTATRTIRQLSSLPLPAQIISKSELKQANRTRLNSVLNE